jgi:hypothetical protein
MLKRLSIPSSVLPFTGTPITGNGVEAAIIPGRCAAPPAAAIITLKPFATADEANSVMRSGVRCAEVMVTWKGMPRAVRSSRPGFRTGRSESEPIVTATRGWGSSDGESEIVDVGRFFLEARILSAS